MVLGDQPDGLLLADLRIALMVGLVELDLCAAEIGQAGTRRERHRLELRMRGIDDLGAELDASLADCPALAEFPVSGKMAPIFTGSAA